MKPSFRFNTNKRLALVCLIIVLCGADLDWIKRRSQQITYVDNYPSRDPEIMALTRTSMLLLRADARLEAITPSKSMTGWIMRGRYTVYLPDSTLFADDAFYPPSGGTAGSFVSLPAGHDSYGNALSAIRRLAQTRNCLFAIDQPEAIATGGTIPGIPVLEIIWTRPASGAETRRCKRQS
ncbi:hypothetical protein [Altererythrobacter aquiaggeris]|uniref:hypothetical protein n=1 Tax=Aestuarierythrobacter aquiaggeris TaxID=1898396 RepID=UPI0030178ADA